MTDRWFSSVFRHGPDRRSGKRQSRSAVWLRVEGLESRVVPTTAVYGTRFGSLSDPNIGSSTSPGAVVQIDAATGTEKVIWQGAAGTGDGPDLGGKLAAASDGTLVFTGETGTSNADGQYGLYALNPAAAHPALTRLGPDRAFTALVAGPRGVVYGTRFGSLSDPNIGSSTSPGAVVQIDAATGTEKVIWQGAAGTGDGPDLGGKLAAASDGTLVFTGETGTSNADGQYGLYALNPAAAHPALTRLGPDRAFTALVGPVIRSSKSPAKNVTAHVSGSTLFLTGDDTANSLGIHQDSAGHVVVTSNAGSIGGKGGTVASGVFTTASTGITSLHIALIGGDDTVVNDTPASGAGAFDFSGSLFVDLGTGTNTLDLAAPTAGAGPVTLGALTVRAGAGADMVTLGGSGAAVNRIGTVSVAVAGGSASVVVDGPVAVGQNLSVSGTAAQLADNSGAPATLTVGGNLKLSGRQTATLGLNDVASSVSVSKGLTVRSAGTAVIANTTAATGLAVTGPIAVAGSKVVVANLGGAQVGSLKVTGGADSGNRVTTGAGFKTTAKVASVSITTAGGGTVDLAGFIAGPLTVQGGAGADRVTIDGAEVSGPVRVLTGGGNDTLTIGAASKFDGTLFVDQGAGDDTMALNTNASRPAIFAGVVTVKQGAGTDAVTGSVGTANGNTFEATGNLFDGGSGTDTAGATNLASTDPLFIHYEG